MATRPQNRSVDQIRSARDRSHALSDERAAKDTAHLDRVLFLADGHIVDEIAEPTAERVLDRMKSFDAAGHVT